MNLNLCEVHLATIRTSYCFNMHDSERGRDIQILIDRLAMIHAVGATLLNLYSLCTVGCKFRFAKDGLGKLSSGQSWNTWSVNSNLARLSRIGRAEVFMLIFGPAETQEEA